MPLMMKEKQVKDITNSLQCEPCLPLELRRSLQLVHWPFYCSRYILGI
ncbi:unnamed protein product [Amoebophrya sp. A25]|nr:unnamed protein product [Amoebophrya sp. A25]|eukprot:GSA25T00011119001.1